MPPEILDYYIGGDHTLARSYLLNGLAQTICQVIRREDAVYLSLDQLRHYTSIVAFHHNDEFQMPMMLL